MGYVLQGTCFLGERAEVLGRVRESVKAPESGRRGAVLLISLCAVALLAMPASSFAGTATSDGSDVRYIAAPGEVNNIIVDLSGGIYTITDTGSNVTLTAAAAVFACQSDQHDVSSAGAAEHRPPLGLCRAT